MHCSGYKRKSYLSLLHVNNSWRPTPFEMDNCGYPGRQARTYVRDTNRDLT